MTNKPTRVDQRGADLRQANLGCAYLEGAIMPTHMAENLEFPTVLNGEGKQPEPKTVEKIKEKGGER